MLSWPGRIVMAAWGRRGLPGDMTRAGQPVHQGGFDHQMVA
jgi:hypothetical protein